MRKVLEEDPDMRDRLGAKQFLVHVGLPGQPLDVRIAADADEALPAPVVRVPHLLHDHQDPEHPAVRLREGLAGLGEGAGIAGLEKLCHRGRGQAPAGPSVVDALAGGRRLNGISFIHERQPPKLP